MKELQRHQRLIVNHRLCSEAASCALLLGQRIASVWDRARAGSESLREAVARAFQLSRWGGSGEGRPLLVGVSHEPWCWERRSHQHSRAATPEQYDDNDAPFPQATQDGHDTRHLAALLYHREAAIDVVAPRPLAFRGCTTPESHHQLFQSAAHRPNDAAARFSSPGHGALRCMASLRGTTTARTSSARHRLCVLEAARQRPRGDTKHNHGAIRDFNVLQAQARPCEAQCLESRLARARP